MNTRNIGNLIELSSDKGYIHRKGTETYFKKGIITDDIDNYEEVESMPKYTRQEYVEKVRELIKERYAIEDEIALYRQRELKPSEYEEYNSYCEECKAKAKELLSNS